MMLTVIKAKKVNSAKELLGIIVRENKEGDKWFRGQANIEYPLLPSVVRQSIVVKDQFNRPVRPHIIKTFSNRGEICEIPDGLYINSFKKMMEEKKMYDQSLSDIEFICLAQHYGVRTRLLDWTTDAVVALFFAIDGRQPDTSAGFYILDPAELNYTLGNERVIYNIDNVPDSGVFPYAFYGPQKDMRMCRQSGNFTIHGKMVWPIDYIPTANNFLKRIEIPDSVCSELIDILNGLGITKKSIYVMDDEKDRIACEACKVSEESFERHMEKRKQEWEKASVKGIERHVYF